MLFLIPSVNNFLKIKSFCFLGIAKTDHGASLVSEILSSGIRPCFGLIGAQSEDQLAMSKKWWTASEWWTRLTSISAPDNYDVSSNKVEELYRRFGVPYIFVPDFNSEVTAGIIHSANVDLIVLTEAPILKNTTIAMARKGMLNIHAAPLPEYRGNGATLWTLYHDDPLYVTAHLIEDRVDYGPILGKRRVHIFKGDTIDEICHRATKECGRLAVEVISKALSDGVKTLLQEDWQGRTFKGDIPDDIRKELDRRFEAREYTHYE